MSLINEALKKAQRQRTEGGEPEPVATDAAGTPAPRVARREKPAGFRSQMLMAAGGGAAVLVLGLIVAGVWFWRSGKKSEPVATRVEVAAVQPPVTTTVKAPPPTSSPPPATTLVANAQPAPVATQPASPPPAPESKPAPVLLVEAPKPAPVTTNPAGPGATQFTLPLSSPATSTASETPALAPAPVVGVAARPSERPKAPVHMVTIIENLRVAGIRAAGDDSKVLMNDRVYRINDVVDRDLGIRLTGVSAKSLTFEDDHGASYTRNF